MESANDNPPSNGLRDGTTEDQLADAIRRSGYPVQTAVGHLLRSATPGQPEGFIVQEEWCFVDARTNELRNLDLRADLRLHEWNPQPRVRPMLTLLIECKQSELPYVFFESGGGIRPHDFPRVSGLRSANIVITSDDNPSSWTLPVATVL